MRTLSTAQDKALLGAGVSQQVRVSVKDSGGTWRDLTSYPGRNMVKSVEWGESADDSFASCTVTLVRELEALSLAPLMQASPLNKAFNPAGSYAALLALNREIKVEAATVGADRAPVSGDWETFFHGYVDSVDAGQGPHIVLQARDLGSALMDRYIEWERVYNWGADGGTQVGIRIWQPSVDFALNEYVAPTDGRRSAVPRFYKCTTAGTTGTAEPTTWPTSSTVSSGTAVFTHVGTISNAGVAVETTIQSILNAEGLSGVTLVTSGSPSWTILQFKQQREPVLEAVKRLAQQIGWDIRYKWNAGAGAFRLTLYQPERTSPSVARNFSKSEYKELGPVRIENSAIRNRVRVVYSDNSDKDAAGNGRRKAVTVEDATSQTAYGLRAMEIAEASSSNIDSSSEATAMANACLKDLKDPIVEVGCRLSYGFPWAELQDYYTLLGNGRHFSADQSLAVYAVRHRAENGVLRTELTLRGKPALGPESWEGVSGRAQPEDTHSFTGATGTGGYVLESASVVGGARLRLKASDVVSGSSQDPATLPEEVEWHLSTTSGFTPDSTTLKGVTQARTVELADLVPGTTYYAKVVPKLRNAGRLVVGQPSDQVMVTAGRGNAGHLTSDVAWGGLPLNGGFETQTDAAGPPDHWLVYTGTWDTQLDLLSDNSGVSGGNYLKLCSTGTGDTAGIYSAWFQVEAGKRYHLSTWRKCVSGSGSRIVSVIVYWYKNDKTTATVGTTTPIQFYLNDSVGTWVEEHAWVTAGSDAKFARVLFLLGSTGESGRELHIDGVRMAPILPAAVWTWTADNLAATNVTEYASAGYMGGGGPFATEVRWVAPFDGVLSDLHVRLLAAGTNMDYTYTLRKNGSNTALTCSTTAGGTSASDTTNFVQVAAGDTLAMRIDSTQNGGGIYAGAGDVTFTVGHFY